MYTAGTYSEL